MSLYEELVANLKELVRKQCMFGLENADSTILMLQAADAIENLYEFADYVASETVTSDDEWENNIHYAFPEIANRKLNKLGIVEKDGAFWHYGDDFDG